MKGIKYLLCAFFFGLTWKFSTSSAINDKIIISKAERAIDVSSQIAKVNAELTLQNTGSEGCKSFLVAVDPKMASHLAYIGATRKGKNEEDDEKLKVKEASVPTNKNVFFLEVEFSSPLAPGKSATVIVEKVYSHVLTPYPASIGQSDKQLVIFNGNHYIYSPYTVKTQTTTVKLSSSSMESHSKLKPTSVSENMITYGPYNNVKPLSVDKMKIHYENNSPFVSVVEMTRLIEVSHWGNIAVEESFIIKHVGALLKGTFSRYDYQRTQTHAAVKSLKVALPAAAKDVYYRDVIGNISTSNLLVQEDAVDLELRPRFPLFGGWKTQYYIGYNVPAYEYLYTRGDNYGLKMRFIDHVFDDFVIEKLTVKVILPEGTKDIKVKTPYQVSEQKRELHHTYLDTVGRPVIILKKENVVESHIQDMEIHYNFKKVLLLQEPLLVVGAFYLLFILVIIVVRMDFSITKDATKESKMKAAGLLAELSSQLNARAKFASLYDSECDKFKTSRDLTAFNNACKKLNGDYSAVSAKIAAHQDALIKEDPEIAEKLHEMQKKETELKQLIDQSVLLAQKVVSKKISKPQYVESNQNNIAKRGRISEEIEKIIESL